MSWFWFIVLAVTYFIGLITVQWLDKVFSLQKNRYHYLILSLMWIFTPIILVSFIIDFTYRFIKKTISQKEVTD